LVEFIGDVAHKFYTFWGLVGYKNKRGKVALSSFVL
jgi:hypothetical protein